MGQKSSATSGLRMSQGLMKSAPEMYFNGVGLGNSAMQSLHTSVKKVKYV